MSTYQCWSTQKERLRENLRSAGDAAATGRILRHAIAQTEQNTMAEQPNDLLRQQVGILFSSFKASLSLLDVSVTTKVWVAQSDSQPVKKNRKFAPALLACLLEAGVAALAYLDHRGLIWPLALAALVMTLVAVLARHPDAKKGIPAEDSLRVTAQPDTEKLFIAIDAQMKGIDRFINDYTYLNEQAALQHGAQDMQNAALLSELMQSIYECEGDTQQEMLSTAERLLAALGVRALEYGPEDGRLFNVLPSLTETSTLSPALISLKDGSLLYRGTAAVLTEPSASSPAMETDVSTTPQP